MNCSMCSGGGVGAENSNMIKLPDMENISNSDEFILAAG